MNESSEERERISERARAIVKDYWDSNRRPLLLSVLGLHLRREFPSSKILRFESLSKLLETSGTVRLVVDPNIAEKIGAIPLDAPVPDDVSELFPRPAPPPKGSLPIAKPMAHPMYFRNFWRAFHTPFDGRRFIVASTDGRSEPEIVDHPPENQAAYELLPSEVITLPASTPLSEKARAVADRIREWLSRHELPEDKFIDAEATAARRVMSAHAPLRYATDEGTNIARALSKLTPSEQARILIPLDILLRMIEK